MYNALFVYNVKNQDWEVPFVMDSKWAKYNSNSICKTKVYKLIILK